jgi:DNA-directed RNA polymerase specialized sigma24 family protein
MNPIAIGDTAMTETSFSDLVNRLRTGDAGAAQELLHRYESALRMEVRCRLGDPRLRRLLDSMDVVQAVLGSFFIRAACGQFVIERPEQLLALLKSMARKKLAFLARQHQAGCRDVRRQQGLDADGVEAPSAEPTPSRIIASRELLAMVRARLSDDERQVADLRGLGEEWSAIAGRLGGTAEARRKQLSRALDRVSEELGLGSLKP